MNTVFGPDFSKALRFFRQECGLKFRYKTVTNLWDEGFKLDALLEQTKKGFVVKIDRECGSPIDALIHELSHQVDIQKRGWENRRTHSQQHGRGWSDAHGMLYRKYHDWLAGQGEK